MTEVLFDWLIYYLISFVVVITGIIIIMDRGTTGRSLSWLLIMATFPPLGVPLYIFFGQTYRKKRMFQRRGIFIAKRKKLLADQRELAAKGWQEHVPHKARSIASLLLNSAKAALTTNNTGKLFFLGEEVFEKMLEDIERATYFIHLEYYSFLDDSVGERFIQSLIKKREQGVEVRLIYDDVGSWGLRTTSIKRMEKAGIEVFPFLKIRFPRLTPKVNYRNHRKISIIDGLVAYTGGMNIAAKYANKTKLNWYDAHLRIQGNVVEELHRVFISDWEVVSGKLLRKASYFRTFPVAFRGIPMQVAHSGADTDTPAIEDAFIAAIYRAERKIFITTPYFIPTQPFLQALQTVARSGIEVHVILSKKSDTKFVQIATLSFIKDLIEGGINVHLFKNGFIHAKMLVIDDFVLSVGSTNMDFRSFRQNFEVNLFIYDKQLIHHAVKQLQFYMQEGQRLTKTWISRRPKREQVAEAFIRLFSPLL